MVEAKEMRKEKLRLCGQVGRGCEVRFRGSKATFPFTPYFAILSQDSGVINFLFIPSTLADIQL
jgi:hypothetical protein